MGLKKIKNGIIVLVTAVFVCSITYFAYQLYLYYNPELELCELSPAESLDYSFSIPTIAMKESVFGMSEEMENKLRNFTDKMIHFQEMIVTKYEKPIKLDFDIRYENGKTILVYSGTACDKSSKNLVEVNEEVVLDFIVKTKDEL